MAFAAVVYWTVGFDAEVDKFFYFMLALVLLVVSASSIGFFLGCAFKDVATANALAPLCMMPIILFGGPITNVEHMSWSIKWI